jgi:hypothetical protein
MIKAAGVNYLKMRKKRKLLQAKMMCEGAPHGC